MFNESRKHKRDVVSDKSPFDHLKFEKRETTTDVLLRKVMRISRTGVPWKTLGISMTDLLDMDYMSVCKIDDLCDELLKEQAEAFKAALDKNVKGKQPTVPSFMGNPYMDEAM